MDVGANHGNWTRSAIRFFPEVQYTLVEPQDHLKVHVQDLIVGGYKIQWLNAAVSDKSGTLPFTIAPNDHSSSLVCTGDAAQQVPMRVITLNELFAPSDAPPPDLIKIDAEGFDLKVLASCSVSDGSASLNTFPPFTDREEVPARSAVSGCKG